MADLVKVSGVAEQIARLTGAEINMLAEVMVHKGIARDLEMLLGVAKQEATRVSEDSYTAKLAVDSDLHIGVS